MSGFLILMDFKGCKWKVYAVKIRCDIREKIVFERIKDWCFTNIYIYLAKNEKTLRGWKGLNGKSVVWLQVSRCDGFWQALKKGCTGNQTK